jgi:hypothetical protein
LKVKYFYKMRWMQDKFTHLVLDLGQFEIVRKILSLCASVLFLVF